MSTLQRNAPRETPFPATVSQKLPRAKDATAERNLPHTRTARPRGGWKERWRYTNDRSSATQSKGRDSVWRDVNRIQSTAVTRQTAGGQRR